MTELIYGYSKVEFERQYNARQWTPDGERLVALNVERSDSARRNRRYHADICWGPKPSNRLDLFLPQTQVPEPASSVQGYPVVLFIHGGYWRSREKSAFSFVHLPLTEAGAIVAVTDYSLCPAVRLSEIVEEMRTLVGWLQKNISEYSGRSDRLHVTGHSAGGHLAAMLAVTDWHERAKDTNEVIPVDYIRSVTPISGLFDLRPLLSHSVNEDLQLVDSEVAILSPSLLDSSAVTAALDIYVGQAESDEFRKQSREFFNTWSANGVDSRFTELEDHNHYTILSDLARPDFEITRGLIERIRSDCA